MISGKTPRLSKNLFDILVKRIQNDELNKYLLKNARLSPEGKFEMTKDSLKSDLERYIWDKLWGYACYSDIDPRSYSQIPYQLFQGYRWNSDWKSGDLLWKDVIVGCHFFGFGEGGRPTWEEFVEYHNIKID
jgi:hypothetical protein